MRLNVFLWQEPGKSIWADSRRWGRKYGAIMRRGRLSRLPMAAKSSPSSGWLGNQRHHCPNPSCWGIVQELTA